MLFSIFRGLSSTPTPQSPTPTPRHPSPVTWISLSSRSLLPGNMNQFYLGPSDSAWRDVTYARGWGGPTGEWREESIYLSCMLPHCLEASPKPIQVTQELYALHMRKIIAHLGFVRDLFSPDKYNLLLKGKGQYLIKAFYISKRSTSKFFCFSTFAQLLDRWWVD